MVSASTATTEEVTVALPADLLAWVDETAAKESQTRAETIARAVFYYRSTLRWRAIQAIAAPAAAAAGLRTEDDVENYLDSLPDAD
jgi:metal-responsive CopG/Arc/MetJ family transcriptional regulator